MQLRDIVEQLARHFEEFRSEIQTWDLQELEEILQKETKGCVKLDEDGFPEDVFVPFGALKIDLFSYATMKGELFDVLSYWQEHPIEMMAYGGFAYSLHGGEEILSDFDNKVLLPRGINLSSDFWRYFQRDSENFGAVNFGQRRKLVDISGNPNLSGGLEFGKWDKEIYYQSDDVVIYLPDVEHIVESFESICRKSSGPKFDKSIIGGRHMWVQKYKRRSAELRKGATGEEMIVKFAEKYAKLREKLLEVDIDNLSVNNGVGSSSSLQINMSSLKWISLMATGNPEATNLLDSLQKDKLKIILYSDAAHYFMDEKVPFWRVDYALVLPGIDFYVRGEERPPSAIFTVDDEEFLSEFATSDGHIKLTDFRGYLPETSGAMVYENEHVEIYVADKDTLLEDACKEYKRFKQGNNLWCLREKKLEERIKRLRAL